MKFNGSLAWQEGLNAISANRAVLVPVAGVFFLVPALMSTWFMSDIQMAVLENLGDPEKAERAFAAMGPGSWLASLLGVLMQMAGFMALLALFRDHDRPTVGEAIRTALQYLPSLIGAIILFALGYSLAMVLVMAFFGGLAVVAGAPGLAVMLGFLVVALVFYVFTKFSLTMPVIVIDRISNPVAALARSWRLTRGNSLRLFGFYLLLGIGYSVLALVAVSVVAAFMGMGQIASGGLAQGSAALIALGLVSGVVGAAVSVVFSGILASIHRQLSGPSTGAIAETFR